MENKNTTELQMVSKVDSDTTATRYMENAEPQPAKEYTQTSRRQSSTTRE